MNIHMGLFLGFHLAFGIRQGHITSEKLIISPGRAINIITLESLK